MLVQIQQEALSPRGETGKHASLKTMCRKALEIRLLPRAPRQSAVSIKAVLDFAVVAQLEEASRLEREG